MRALGALVDAVGMATAHARPAPPRRAGEPKDPFESRISPCDVTRTWANVKSRLVRQGYKVLVLDETEGAKLLAIRWGQERDATLGLFLLERGTWTRHGFYATLDANIERLAFKRTDQDGYRMDVGSAASTSVQLEDGAPMKASLRRIFTTECRGGRGCRTIATSCDALVDGKALWAFRGRMMWTATGLVMVTGDTQIAGRPCTPPKSVRAPVDEALGDPLE